MNCAKIKEMLLSDYIDGEIQDATLLNNIEIHLKQCTACQEYVAILTQGIKPELANAKEIKSPNIVWQKIKENISAQKKPNIIEQLKDVIDEGLNLFVQPKIVFATVAASLLLIVLIFSVQSKYYFAKIDKKIEHIELLALLANGGDDVSEGADSSLGTTVENYLH